MQTPIDTLLLVLQVVSVALALLMGVTAWQTRRRRGSALWVAAFATGAISQWLKLGVAARWGHAAGLPFGHLGGPISYGLLYVGVRRYLRLPARLDWVVGGCALAVMVSFAAIWHGMAYISLAMTAVVAAAFQALTAATFRGVRGNGMACAVATLIFAFSAVESLVRAAAITLAWEGGAPPAHVNVVWLLVFIAMNILQAGALMFLVNQSLLDDLQNLADYDPLTGLLNRRGMDRRFQRGRAGSGSSARMGMLCMDLDHFKDINDRFGHGVGDDVLRQFGQRIRDHSRPLDTPVRQGGEEFCLIVEAASETELVALAERHREGVENTPFQTRAGPLQVTVSIGAALAAGAHESLEALGERADQSLLVAKREGRNRVALAPTRSTS
ncbi:MAG: GGDEF domain-containing protein [Proteobacteria bacterium]|nr:GGDEF domain-containing protein [Pseudomonadota bacterium]